MRRLTIGQRKDDFFYESFYYTLLHIFIYPHFHLRILGFITCSDIFIVFYRTAIQNVYTVFIFCHPCSPHFMVLLSPWEQTLLVGVSFHFISSHIFYSRNVTVFFLGKFDLIEILKC